MFSCARQLSQGAQRAYCATRTPKVPINEHVFDMENYGTHMITPLKNSNGIIQERPILNLHGYERSNAGNYNDNDNGLFISNFPDFNIDELNDDNFNKEFYRIINDEHIDTDNDMDYNLSSMEDNPYSTLSISDLMRSCSKNSK